ncbi:MAG: thioredoxin domain-containing protein [Spirochaetes bacterium]|jgi:uncharacterized membrane protein/predicted DsbA family dithiol-disulfide isomerase|nr:thioredoxin domain-containing protein [Spirochaetota bacterium]
MKKAYILLSLLSFAGVILSVILLSDHYIPEKTMALLSCGDGLQSSCSELSQSPYSMFFGIPIASYGFFFYIWIFLSLHLFRESGEGYWKSFIYLMVPVSIAGIFFDIVLGSLLVYLQIFCTFCIMTYIVNIGILIVAIFAYHEVKKSSGLSFKQALFGISDITGKNDDRKFSTGTFIYYTAILFIFVVSFSLYLEERTGDKSGEQKKITEYIEKYKEKPLTEEKLPQTGFVLGDVNAPLTIHVFTDPLCPACRNFHFIEKALLKKYAGKIKVKHYYYPLDTQCNPGVSRDVNPGACGGARLFYAADVAGMYDQVLANFYSNYDDVRKLLRERADVEDVIALVTENESEQKALLEAYSSEEAQQNFSRHLEWAEGVDISATPTLIMNGRLMQGYPKDKYMDAILRYELTIALEK